MPVPEQIKPALRSYLAATPSFAAGKETPGISRALTRIARLLGAANRRGAFVATALPAARDAADRSGERWRAGKLLSPIETACWLASRTSWRPSICRPRWAAAVRRLAVGKDAASVPALRDAGAVILGKTVTTEFAASESARHAQSGGTSPHMPGGSSSGSAAAVGALQIVKRRARPRSFGSTIRRAGFCGCCRFFKPSGQRAQPRRQPRLSKSQACPGGPAASLADVWQIAHAIVARVGGDAGYARPARTGHAAAGTKPRCLALL